MGSTPYPLALRERDCRAALAMTTSDASPRITPQLRHRECSSLCASVSLLSLRAFLFLSLRGAQRRGNPVPEPTPLPLRDCRAALAMTAFDASPRITPCFVITSVPLLGIASVSPFVIASVSLSVIARSAATWQSRSRTNAPTPPRLPRFARNDSIRRVAANNPLLRHRECSSLRHRERFSFCHCEERSDVAIPFRNQRPYPSEIAALRSQ